MKIAVFGGTGPTGLQVLNQAVDRGHEVLAIVRNPDRIPEDLKSNSNFKFVVCSLFDSEALEKELKGIDAVVSTLGAKGFKQYMKCDLYTTSMDAIVRALKSANPDKEPRLVVMTSWCTEYKSTNPKVVEFIFKPLVIGSLLKNMGVMERNLMQVEGVNWTVVRPPGLGDGPQTDIEFSFADDQWVEGASVTKAMARADVAKVMLNCAEDPIFWSKKCVAIGQKN